jgi:hypothetical protein
MRLSAGDKLFARKQRARRVLRMRDLSQSTFWWDGQVGFTEMRDKDILLRRTYGDGLSSQREHEEEFIFLGTAAGWGEVTNVPAA